MQSAFGVEHGDEFAKSFRAGFKNPRGFHGTQAYSAQAGQLTRLASDKAGRMAGAAKKKLGEKVSDVRGSRGWRR